MDKEKNKLFNLVQEEIFELEKMKKAYAKYYAMDSDTMNETEIWQRYFEEDWGDFDDFMRKLNYLDSNKLILYNEDFLKKSSDLNKKVRKIVEGILRENNEIKFKEFVEIAKKTGIARMYRGVLVVNKKTGYRGSPNFIEEQKNLTQARVLVSIFNNIVKIEETNNSRKGKTQGKTYKLTPLKQT